MRTPLLAVVLLLFSAAAPALWGQAVTFETIAVAGGAAPETGGAVYASFDDLRANAQGDLVFSARLQQGTAGVDATNDHGIWRRKSGAAFEKIARTNDITSPFDRWSWDINQDPLDPEDAPVRFATLGAPVLGADGNVAFTSSFQINDDTVWEWQDQAVWVTGEGTITRPGEGNSTLCWLVCNNGTSAYFAYDSQGAQTQTVNGEGYGFRTFSDPTVAPDGTIVFGALINDWREVAPDDWQEFRLRGLWYYERPAPGGPFNPQTMMSEPPFAAVQELEPQGVPGASFDTFGSGTSGPGSAAEFLATLVEGSGGVSAMTSDGIWQSDGSAVTSVARGGDAAPGMPEQFYRFGRAKLNASGQAAFWASLVSGADPSATPSHREGVWLRRFGGLEALALEGASAPGCPTGERWSAFFNPEVNADGIAAFLAHRRGAFDEADASIGTGIWTGGIAGQVRLVARSGETAVQGGGARFAGFSAPSINRLGQVAFTARLDRADAGVGASNDYGCWAMNASGSLVMIMRTGSSQQVGPGDSRQVAALQISDFSDAGELYLKVDFTDQTQALIRAALPAVSWQDYGDWAAGAIPNPAERAATLDLDGDGIVNLLEFAFGLNPLVPDGGSYPNVAMTSVPGAGESAAPGGGDDTLSVNYLRRLDASGITYRVMVSDDMVTWTEATELVDTQLVGNGVQEVTVRDMSNSSASPRRFIRVVVDEGPGT